MAELQDMIQAGLAGLAVILAGMIKIPPIKINFWGWLGRSIGRAINGEVMEKVETLNQEVQKLKEEEELERARQARQRILRFNDEILHRCLHSKEHFDEILEDIDLYEDYCAEHEDYENNKAVLAIATIRDVYTKCLKEHDFLTYTRD